MKRIACISALVAAAFVATEYRAEAVEWPTAEAELKAGFGQNDRGAPSVGMRFAGEDAVRAADAGELVFSVSAEGIAYRPGAFPHPLGEWAAIDHGNGILSVYGGMAAEERKAAETTLVEKGARIGRTGTSGWSAQPGLFFSIYDRAERRWVNPTMIAPKRADGSAPTIESVELIGKDGQAFPLPQTKNVRQGSYRVVVDAADGEQAKRAGRLAPQRLICLVDGAEQGAVHLETIKTENGRLQASRRTTAPATEIFMKNGAYDLGEIRLSRGRSSFEIVARDAAGNERTASYIVVVE